MTDEHLQRLLNDTLGTAGLERLASIAPTDLQSLLLEIYRRRAAKLRPANVLAAYQDSRFFKRSPASPAVLAKLEQWASKIACDAFEQVELSPVCPLGTISTLTGLTQDWCIATERNSEVVSDPTNVLALECALRRRGSSLDVKLSSLHRVLRPQNFQGPLSFAHFKIFAMCTAGRDRGNFEFELAALREQIRVHLRFLHLLCDKDSAFTSPKLIITCWSEKRVQILQALSPLLEAEWPQVLIVLDSERRRGRNYYSEVCFEIVIQHQSAGDLSISDGGFVDWTAKLLSNRKERMLISGIGIERLAVLQSQLQPSSP